ncbi:N5-glutamine methyltransferase, modifies release factors RF-1 and RF-2 [Candidatus Methylobacter favarea]|uniref:Release factor glutamine methyltransferase n=1 Tax=Candidatus Methylobacter favarea TaxID=2707345 RepID=A0A8S0Y5R0_9GAMM|nr:peptide chain release factor N(5)-glutamine methyltransferase [Candidatus Methylobacter favarea]CAA9889578.1 N5-glutamine methyltransferase, modifies release factors RF-1 and RF-2 [Candidatus Methylobacter favarea]
MQTIQSALAKAAALLADSSDSAALDAEILLCRILDKDRSYLRAWPDRQLEPEHINHFWTLMQERQKGMPIAYITGNREFWSRDFHVTPDVLIPRPETELLVELSLKLIPSDQCVRIIDLGTGSGIIAVTLALECPHAKISATDLSLSALSIAQLNAHSHHVTHIDFYHSDWLTGIPDAKFNLVISNPPYIAEDDSHLQKGDIRFEPQTALRASRQGLNEIQIIADTARNHLEPGGHLLVEHGYNQQQQVQAIFKQFNYDNIQTYKDLSGQPRVTYGQWNYCSYNRRAALVVQDE